MTRRFAIYFAPPPGSELEAFGRHWLGRDHITGAKIEQPKIDGLDAEALGQLTRSARHYGFHATLKPPFVLKPGMTADAFHNAAEAFAASRQPFEAPPLQLSELSRWIAFTLSASCPAMDRLAADCIREFEPFRADLSAADLERRREAGLTPRQDDQLLAYGYPYIFEDFHFHMTLAGPLDPPEQERILDILSLQASTVKRTALQVDAIAVYEQTDRDRPFTQTARFPFLAS